MRKYNMIDRFQGNYTKKRKTTDIIIIHHAAALYRQQTGAEDVQAVANFHVHTRKWPGIGYHICLAEEESGGKIARYDVSALELERAHTWGLNDQAVGISCLTNFIGMPDSKWVEAVAETVRELLQRWPGARVVGHKEAALPGHATACPGPLWHRWKPDMLRLAGKMPSTVSYQIMDRLSEIPGDNFAAVREGPGRNYPEATINGIPYRLMPGTVWDIDSVTGQWAHLANHMGFVHVSLIDPITRSIPFDDLAILSPARISRGQFLLVLAAANSPALAAGDDMYSICLAYEVCPAVMLAIFEHESSLGKRGICATYRTHSPGNVRTPWASDVAQEFEVPDRGTFTRYPSWQAGTEDMCKRLRARYVARGLDTIRKAIPVWAPSSDGNKPERYIAAVLSNVREWQRLDQQ